MLSVGVTREAVELIVFKKCLSILPLCAIPLYPADPFWYHRNYYVNMSSSVTLLQTVEWKICNTYQLLKMVVLCCGLLVVWSKYFAHTISMAKSFSFIGHTLWNTTLSSRIVMLIRGVYRYSISLYHSAMQPANHIIRAFFTLVRFSSVN